MLWDCWKPCPTEVEGVGVYSLVFKTTQGRTSETFEGALGAVMAMPCVDNFMVPKQLDTPCRLASDWPTKEMRWSIWIQMI